ncbi:uncharacterized protein PRCAT00006125001 [Priceomyces carsonii]|uniref:uncharacterized protein n=1 Tax=Priceomyces carsonii TaxID=28549 RepID=UPI002EDB3790|nr:unnamed protein product [Priceomyces carsonii]
MTDNPGEESLDDRLTHELTELSTKLVTSVARQSELEESMLHLHKENVRIRGELSSLKEYQEKYESLLGKYDKLQLDFDKTDKLKKDAEAQNTKLQGEVEDLTASLFNEANQMVSNASRETYNFKVKNRKLHEELEEKDTIITDLQEQLKYLKDLFMKIEDKQKGSSRNGTPLVEQSSEFESELDNIIYSPTIKAIRLDLPNYQHDFKIFIYTIIKPTFQFDLLSLKNTKFFRRVWMEELENSISSIPSMSNANFINRWQKGKTFWNLLVEGKAIIEPIKGVNETFKLTYKGASGSYNNAPVATKEPCSFCAESRNDNLEHARLYSLKLLNPEPPSATPSTSSLSLVDNNEVIASYSLCNYCLIKLRNICDFFAKLRLIHSNVYKIEQNRQYDEVINIANNFQFKRALNESIPDTSIMLSEVEESKLTKLYIILASIRAKIFWSKIGFWDLAENTVESNLDELSTEAFAPIIATEHVHSSVSSPKGDDQLTKSEEEKVQTDTLKHETIERRTSHIHAKDFKLTTDEEGKVKLHSGKTVASEQSETTSPSTTNQTSDNDINDQSVDEEFADTSETLPSPDQPDDTLTQPASQQSSGTLKRKNSKSKQLKKEVNSGLDNTMEMLKESIKE